MVRIPDQHGGRGARTLGMMTSVGHASLRFRTMGTQPPHPCKTRSAVVQEEQFQALIRLFGKLHVKGGRDKDTGKFFECARETAV